MDNNYYCLLCPNLLSYYYNTTVEHDVISQLQLNFLEAENCMLSKLQKTFIALFFETLCCSTDTRLTTRSEVINKKWGTRWWSGDARQSTIWNANSNCHNESFHTKSKGTTSPSVPVRIQYNWRCPRLHLD